MKLYLTIIFIVLKSALGFCQEADFSIDKAVHKFPKTIEGKVLEYYFVITNNGDIPLIIYDYTVECSCTKVILPLKPIAPGQSYRMKLTFDTKGKYYLQDRTISLQDNTRKGSHALRVKVNVIPHNE